MSDGQTARNHVVTAFKQNKRKNVLFACSTCKKRKIRCSGIYPCLNCVTYQCQCDLPNNDGLLIVNGVSNKIQKKPIGAKKIKIQAGKINSYNELDNARKTTSSESYYSIDKTFSVAPNNEKILKDGVLLVANNTDSSEIKNTTATINKHKNRFCSTELPKNKNLEISSIINDDTKVVEQPENLYKNDITNECKYKHLIYTLEYLKSSPVQNVEIEKLIKSTTEELEHFIDTWEPQIDYLKISRLNPAYGSIETQLMKNKYSGKVNLTEMASLEIGKSHFNADTNTNENELNSNSKPRPLLSESFGLYCPYETFSLHGFGFLLHKYSVDDNLSPEIDALIKMTLIILLKYFNLQCLNYRGINDEIVDPLETYMKGYHTNSMELQLSNNVMRENHNVSDGLNDVSYLKIIINHLPQPFTEKTFGITTQQLIDLTQTRIESYKQIIAFLESYLNKLQNILQKLTHVTYTMEDNDFQLTLNHFRSLCKVYDILMPLCHYHLNYISNHFRSLQPLEYLELLLQFAKYMEHSIQSYTSERILNLALLFALRLGITSWEYYIGMEEIEAEKYRRVWWEIYSYEVRLMIDFKSGKTLIENDKISCLLPEPFKKLGFIDMCEFLNNIETSVIDDNLRLLDFQDILYYGTVGLAIILGDFYSTVLYNKRYLNIKNVQKPHYIRERYITEISEYTQRLTAKLDMLEMQLFSIFQYGEDTKNANLTNEVLHSRRFASWFYSYRVISLRAASTLMYRLHPQGLSTLFTEKMVEFSKDIYQCWRAVMDISLSSQTGIEIWLVLRKSAIISFLVASRLLSDYRPVEFDDIVKQVQVFGKFILLNKNIVTTLDDETFNTRMVNDISPYYTIFAILIRLILIDYMHKNGLNKREICMLMKSKDPNSVFLVECVLKHDSYVYKFTLRSISQFNLPTNIKQMIKSQYGSISQSEREECLNETRNEKCFISISAKNARSTELSDKNDLSPRELFIEFVKHYLECLNKDDDLTSVNQEIMENQFFTSPSGFEGDAYDFFNDKPFSSGLDELYDLFWNNGSFNGM